MSDEHEFADDDPAEFSVKAIFRCSGRRRTANGERVCSYEAEAPWAGRCPGCGRPYSIIEPPRRRVTGKTFSSLVGGDEIAEEKKISTKISEIDEVLSGGLCEKTTYVLSGQPGAGKTQLILRMFDQIARDGAAALYASTEETSATIRSVAKRTGATNEHVFVCGTDTVGGDIVRLVEEIRDRKPRFVAVDSLQKGYLYYPSEAGSVSQCNAVMNYLTGYVQKHRICMIVTSQITGTGDVKGGESVVHNVDVDLSLFACTYTGELCRVEDSNLRIFKVGKTRRGAAGLSAMFRMTPTGLVTVSEEELEDLKPSTRRKKTDDKVVYLADKFDKPTT